MIAKVVIYWTDYFSNHYEVIAIDLSKQIKLKKLDLKQNVNFIGKLEENNGATVFFIIKKSEKTTFNFLQNYVSIIQNENTKNHKFFK